MKPAHATLGEEEETIRCQSLSWGEKFYIHFPFLTEAHAVYFVPFMKSEVVLLFSLLRRRRFIIIKWGKQFRNFFFAGFSELMKLKFTVC